MESGFMTIVSFLVLLLEAVGVAVIVGGFVVSTIVYIAQPPLWATHAAYQAYRRRSVRGLILGLEFLVAADIIKTVAIDYTLESVMLLGVIILIRSFLVFALHFEIDGRFPWSRGESSE
jgi:uncharacterized membrane protein